MFNHVSVLLNEAIDMLQIKSDGIYVDCTLGGAGHSAEILKRLDTGHLYCFDQDENAIQYAKEKLSKISNNFTIIHANFADIKKELEALSVTKVDGILYDLGVSSPQFDEESRGFSYRYDSYLDMRMNQKQALSAYEVVNQYSYQDLVRILYKYADEKNAKSIARHIEEARKEKPIETTFELVDIIKKSMRAKDLRKKGHPAKKTFQAIRIEVNDELHVFDQSIHDSLDLLNIGGRIAVITFHSLEDKIAKYTFNEYASDAPLPKTIAIIPEELKAKYKLINKKPITATEEELENNNRAHSAKLRGIERIKL